jgi:hypothetical protein
MCPSDEDLVSTKRFGDTTLDTSDSSPESTASDPAEDAENVDQKENIKFGVASEEKEPDELSSTREVRPVEDDTVDGNLDSAVLVDEPKLDESELTPHSAEDTPLDHAPIVNQNDSEPLRSTFETKADGILRTSESTTNAAHHKDIKSEPIHANVETGRTNQE